MDSVPTDETYAPAPRSLGGLAKAMARCRRCPLYAHATQAVPGDGLAHAAIMLVGEQPGNDEDLVGKPFVGPAGRLLDKALAAAKIDRRSVFITNAVKHFKFEIRGKRRLHKRPNAHEIDVCRMWNELERKLVRPRVIVAMGATAARSVFGKAVTVAALRGRIAEQDGALLTATIHPSWLLRMPDRRQQAKEFEDFVRDLAVARDAA